MADNSYTAWVQNMDDKEYVTMLAFYTMLTTNPDPQVYDMVGIPGPDAREVLTALKSDGLNRHFSIVVFQKELKDWEEWYIDSLPQLKIDAQKREEAFNREGSFTDKYGKLIFNSASAITISAAVGTSVSVLLKGKASRTGWTIFAYLTGAVAGVWFGSKLWDSHFDKLIKK